MIDISRQPLPLASEVPANWDAPDEATTDSVPADASAAATQTGDAQTYFAQLFGPLPVAILRATPIRKGAPRRPREPAVEPAVTG